MNARETNNDASSRTQPGNFRSTTSSQELGDNENKGSQNLSAGMEPGELAAEKGLDAGQNNQDIPPGKDETLGNP